MENEKKEKVKKIFRGIWLGVTTFVTFIFTICVVIGCSQQNKQSNAYSEYDVVETYDNEYQLKYDNYKNINWFDTYTYYISADELNNYTWNHVVDFMVNIIDDSSTFVFGEDIIYKDVNFDFYSANTSINYSSYYGSLVDEQDTEYEYYIYFNTNRDTEGVTGSKKFLLYNNDLDSYESFNDYIQFTYPSDYRGDFDAFKQAIELDVAENQPPYSFDDENYQITISADYFNYEYRHLYEVLMANGDYLEDALFGTYMTYNDVQYNYADYSQDFTSFEDCVIYQKPTYRTYILLDDDYHFHYVYVQNDSLVYEDMDYSVVWKLNSSTYLLIKSAIAQDLEYGEYVSIFGELTDSTTGFIGVLNSGIQEVVNVFYYNNALTTIGILSVLVIAISLGYFLFRLLIGLIRMRG